jgi:ketosteroid isomerase-like protein
VFVSETELERNKQTVVDFFAAWSAGDFGAVAKYVDPECVYWTVRSRTDVAATTMFERIEATYRETVSGLHFTLGHMTAEDDRVSVLVEGRGQFPGREEYVQLYHMMVRVRDGRVHRLAMYYDTALSNRVMRGEGTETGPLASHATPMPPKGKA